MRPGSDHVAALPAALGPFWAPVEGVLAVAAQHGLPALLVGGCVRDLLLGRPLHDVDLVVEGDAVALGHRVASALGGRCVEHGAFGTARWEAPAGAHIDLATARTEVYDRPAALPRVTAAPLALDLQRRDFSVNAMALRVVGDRGELVDPHGGRHDLEARQLRVLHPGSFRDDPTRALRAARFAARFGFSLEADSATLLADALRDGVFGELGLERWGRELDHLLREAQVQGAWERLRAWGLAAALDPALAEDARLAPALTGAHLASAAGDTALGWLALAAALPPEARTRRLRLVPGALPQQRRWLYGPERVALALLGLHALDRADQAERLGSLDGVELRFAALHGQGRPAAEALAWWEAEGRHRRPAFGGAELLAAGLPPGPAVGRALRAARRAAWSGAEPAAQWSAALAAAEG